MLRLIKLRDRKEAELEGILYEEKVYERNWGVQKTYFKEKLKAYKEWLKKHNLEATNEKFN